MVRGSASRGCGAKCFGKICRTTVTTRNHIYLTPKRIAFTLGAMVMTLLAIHLAIIYLHFVKGYQHLRGFVHGFYFDHEANIPSLYSALAILLASILLWQIGAIPEEKAKKQSTTQD